MARGSISVSLGGQEFRVRNDGDGHDASWLRRVARHVDSTMDRIRERTGTVDTRELALLTALNLGREALDLRERSGEVGDPARIQALIQLAESALED
jgi:cell division protein ZapA (FtsZ GTPase activity inhibitor)